MRAIVLIFGIILWGFNIQYSCAGKLITGVVYDENNQLLAGVTVMEKSSSNGTITDVNGKYSLTVSDAADILVFSFSGFQTQEVRIVNNTKINIIMQSDQVSLDEVKGKKDYELEECVVVGYGVRKKTVLTGAVSAVALPGQVPQISNYFRITSYNVCYTKLLRNEFNMQYARYEFVFIII